MVSLRDIFDERMDEFMPEYTFTEQEEIIRSLASFGEMLALVFPDQEAAITMTALRHIIRSPREEWDWSVLAQAKIDTDWRAVWSEIDGWNDTSRPPFLDQLHDLNAFANFGVIPIWQFAGHPDLATERGADIAARLKAAEDVPAYIEGICSKIDKFAALLPRNDGPGQSSLGQTLVTRDQARARLALDLNQPISLHALALLSGVTPKRIQNAIYAKTDEAPLVGKNGLIAPEACEPWLTARDFRKSIWKQVCALGPLSAGWGENVIFEEDEGQRMMDDYIFVPVSNDGSYFSPSLRREGKGHGSGFTIGAKGSEEVIEDFDEAVRRLTMMETPRWRRPNSESGNWGIVSGQTWKRVRRADLERVS